MIIVYKEPNKNNKLEFSKKELEDLLDKAYNEGYAKGKNEHWYTWTAPTITTTPSITLPYTTSTINGTSATSDNYKVSI